MSSARRRIATAASKTAQRNALARGEDTRAALMRAALDAFAKHGYQAMSVRELTRSLDVSHNIVHHHFGSKKALWRAALEFGLTNPMKQVVSLYEGAIQGANTDPVEVIREMVRDAILIFARFPSIARIIAHESAYHGERLDYLYDHFIGPTAQALQRFLQSAAVKGLRKLDPRFVTLFVVAGVPALFTHSALAGKLGVRRPVPEAVIDRYALDVAELLVGGLVEHG